MRTIVIGDIHGDCHGLMAILRATGALDPQDRRAPDTRVIQLGDLIHGAGPRSVPYAGIDDVEALRLGAKYCDEILIGNHELPHLYEASNFPRFGGMRALSGPGYRALYGARDAGKLRAATAHDGWLLTHAGVHVALFAGYGGLGRSAEETAVLINEWYTERLDTVLPLTLFDGIGYLRGGDYPQGGIFWCDWRELTADGVVSPIPQVVGHSPQEDGPVRHGNLWCVDVGAPLSGRVAALVQPEVGADWVPMVVTLVDEQGGTLVDQMRGSGHA
jgi:hypothetical protein